MLIDSNIIIYSAQPPYADLRRFIAIHAPAVSAISYVEVLGYHRLIEQHRQHFVQFFRTARVLPLSQAVLDQAVALRRRRRMSLGDAIIAGTALAYDLTLVTRYQWLGDPDLKELAKKIQTYHQDRGNLT